jgi:hypothetical protein
MRSEPIGLEDGPDGQFGASQANRKSEIVFDAYAAAFARRAQFLPVPPSAVLRMSGNIAPGTMSARIFLHPPLVRATRERIVLWLPMSRALKQRQGFESNT